jgi:hypothetical protein
MATTQKTKTPPAVAEISTPNVRSRNFSEEDAVAADQANIVLSGSPRDLIHRAAEGMRDMSRLWLATGYALLKARSETENGQFKKYLQAVNIPEQRAYEAIAAANLYTRSTPEQRVQLFSLGKSQATLLATAEPEVVEELLSDKEIHLDGVSVRQLRERIRNLESAVETEQRKVEAEKQRTKAVESRLRLYTHEAEKSKSPLLPATTARRLLALAHVGRIEANLEFLWRDFEKETSESQLPESNLRIEAVYFAALGVAAAACKLAADMRVVAPELPNTLTPAHWLGDDETAKWLSISQQIVSDEHLARVEAEQDKNSEPAKRGVGRPRKQTEAKS